MRIEQHIVAAWASQLTSKIIGDAINALQKMDSEEMLSGDSGLKNVWEEICVQVQGEHTFFWEAYIETMESLLSANAEPLDQGSRLALWSVTDEGWNFFYDHHADDEGSVDVLVNNDEIVSMLMDKLLSEASDYESPSITRFLDRFDEFEDEEDYEEEDDEDESDSQEVDDPDGEVGLASTTTRQSLATNVLQLSLAEFKRATKVFTPKRLKLAVPTSRACQPSHAGISTRLGTTRRKYAHCAAAD